ncbi:MAG TPA: hypothetical protein VEC14_02400, partial [Reyranellaceae bacterium]|nr:hypothetical protein [Reyranellaceae bacterium]
MARPPAIDVDQVLALRGARVPWKVIAWRLGFSEYGMRKALKRAAGLVAVSVVDTGAGAGEAFAMPPQGRSVAQAAMPAALAAQQAAVRA